MNEIRNNKITSIQQNKIYKNENDYNVLNWGNLEQDG